MATAHTPKLNYRAWPIRHAGWMLLAGVLGGTLVHLAVTASVPSLMLRFPPAPLAIKLCAIDTAGASVFYAALTMIIMRWRRVRERTIYIVATIVVVLVVVAGVLGYLANPGVPEIPPDDAKMLHLTP